MKPAGMLLDALSQQAKATIVARNEAIILGRMMKRAIEDEQRARAEAAFTLSRCAKLHAEILAKDRLLQRPRIVRPRKTITWPHVVIVPLAFAGLFETACWAVALHPGALMKAATVIVTMALGIALTAWRLKP